MAKIKSEPGTIENPFTFKSQGANVIAIVDSKFWFEDGEEHERFAVVRFNNNEFSIQDKQTISINKIYNDAKNIFNSSKF